MAKYSRNFIANYMAGSVQKIPDDVVVICGEKKLTWKELDDRSSRLAQALISMGVKKDDKVLLMMHNRPEFIESNYAIQKCGAIPVPVNYRFTAHEIEFQADNSDSVAFILEDLWLDPVQKARPALNKIKSYICAGKCPPDMMPYEKAMSDNPAKNPDVPTGEDDVCVICYTGGTTGFPKGVMLTYGAHVDMLRAVALRAVQHIADMPPAASVIENLEKTETMPGAGMILKLMNSTVIRRFVTSKVNIALLDVVLKKVFKSPKRPKRMLENRMGVFFPSFPLFHDASYQLLIHMPVAGNMILMMPGGVTFDPEKVLKMIEREKPVMMCNVPTGWKMLIEYPDFRKYNVKSVFLCVSGGGLFPADVKKKTLEAFRGALMVDMLGQTEMTPVIAFRIDASPDTVEERNVGKPMVETRVIGEDGKDLPQGKIGEILYKSSTMMKGYYGDKEKTEETIKDGWLYSGDLGYIDDNGEIRVVERKKECIITGGEKVFPLEVEQVISTHPDVQEVCVIGIPDAKWGKSIRAVVQTVGNKKLDASEIIATCEGRLAGYKKPRSVVFVKEFPVSPIGKMLREKVRELYGKA